MYKSKYVEQRQVMIRTFLSEVDKIGTSSLNAAEKLSSINGLITKLEQELSLILPSRYQIEDVGKFSCVPENSKPNEMNYVEIPAEVLAIHFYPGKVKYDLELKLMDEMRSRLYNVDSAFMIEDYSKH